VTVTETEQLMQAMPQAGPQRVLALDIGGTKLAVGIVTRSGQVLARQRSETDRGARPPAIMDALETMARVAMKEAPGPVDAIGIS